MSLPTLDTTASQALSPQCWALFHHVQTWLTRERSHLGSNKHIELANPRPTLNGITCDLRKVPPVLSFRLCEMMSKHTETRS